MLVLGNVAGLAGGDEVGALGQIGDFPGGEQVLDDEIAVHMEFVDLLRCEGA